MNLRLNKTVFEEMRLHAQETYPEECCGIILSGNTDDSSDIVHRCDNVQNRLHAEDPQKHPRDATIAYYIDPAQFLKVLKEVEEKNLKLKAFYHSHPKHESYFSAEDKARATAWDDPLYPDTAYVVLSVYDRKVKDVRAFGWDEEARDFLPVAIEIK